MIRRAFTMRLKPDSLAEYKHHHDNIWPELVAEIERSGIASITTFQRDLDLFLVSEIADEAAWDKLWNSEVHRRWAELMQPLMHLRDDGIVEAGELAEVFHIKIDSNGQVSVAGEIAPPVDELIMEALAHVEDELDRNPAAAEPPASEAPSQGAAEPAAKAAGGQGAETDELIKTVHAWASAWAKKDVAGYLAHYAKDFKTPKGETRGDWENTRKQRIGAPKKIEVGIESPKVSISGDNAASVSFRQIYRSDVIKTSGTKTLVMVKSNGKWLIREERVN